jgi:hypothetical protein
LKNAKRSTLEMLVDDIISRSASDETVRIATKSNELVRLARRDYVRSLRKHLPHGLIQDLVVSARRVWPHLNRKTLKPAHPRTLKKRAARLDIHFQAKPYKGPEGLALRGFYVDDPGAGLKRPLIYINTAHHPAAVSATYCHEMGHFLTAEITKQREAGVHFYFDSAYESHLDDRTELAADALVSLAAYPEPLARLIFSQPWNWALVAKADKLGDEAFKKVFEHVRELTGFEFKPSLPVGQNLNYLAGLIHYAKLRWALLAEYDL